MNFKKDSENTPVKGGTMADLGERWKENAHCLCSGCRYGVVANSCWMFNEDYSGPGQVNIYIIIYIYIYSLWLLLSACSLSDELDDDFPGRVRRYYDDI